MAAGETRDTTSASTETRTAESASQNHKEEQNDARTLISSPLNLSQQETHESSQSGLFQARVASNLTASQKSGIDDYTDSSEDHDFEALSNFDDLSSQDGTTSDSDETTISDFDELEGVSEGELSFSDQSHPQSPLLLGSTKTTLSNVVNISPPTCISLEDARANAIAVPIEPMDTGCEDRDKENCCSDNDSTMCSPVLAYQYVNSPISLRTNCTESVGGDLIAALPNSECEEQHIPGTREEAKKPEDEGDTDNDTMSHLSDKEWSELSFESPVFVQGGNGNNALVGHTQCCKVGTARVGTQQQCILPTVTCDETGQFTNSIQLRKNSAFDCLEDYEDTLYQSEDETLCVDASAPHMHSSIRLSDTTCSDTMLTRRDSPCEKDGTAPAAELSATSTTSPLSTHDITDEDFCWDK